MRLKGGDPMMFGRATEEIAALRAARNCDRDRSRRHGGARRRGVAADFADRARAGRGGCNSSPPTPMMASCPRTSTGARYATRAPPASSIWASGPSAPLAERLLAHGADPATPALLVERATCPDERRIVGTLASLPAKAAAEAPSGPCLILIGEVFAASAEAGAAHRYGAGGGMKRGEARGSFMPP